MPLGGRNSFSTEDDDLLVKYLAQHSVVGGRKGTRIYKQLTDNASGQWPWSSRHPLQSWRARYMRDSDDFERRIRVFNRRQANAPSTQPPSSPDTLQDREEPSSSRKRKLKESPTQDSGKRIKRSKKDIPAAVANIGFVQVSQILGRRPAQARAEDKGEGCSRHVVQAKPPATSQSRIEKHAFPTLDDHNEHLFQEVFEDEEDDVEVNHMLTDPIEPDSDEPQLSKPCSPPLHSIPPSPRHDVRLKIPRGSSDGVTTTAADSGFFESPPPFPNLSDDIFAGSSDTDRPSRSISRSKPRPVPKLVESLFGGERHKQPSRRVYSSSSDSDSRQEGKRGKKQKTLGVYAIEPQWPPVRASRKQKSADLQQRVSGANGTAPSYSERNREQNQTLGFPGHTGSSSSLPSTNLVPPSTNLVQPSRKGKERQIDIDTGDGFENPSLNQSPSRHETGRDAEEEEEEEEEPLFTQPTRVAHSSPLVDSSESGSETPEEDKLDEEREMTEPGRLYEDDHDDDEPLFTQASNSQLFSHPTSPPGSSPHTSSIEPEPGPSSPNDNAQIPDPDPIPDLSPPQSPINHPFDLPPESRQQSHTQPPSPKNFLPDQIHPFDTPDPDDEQSQPSTPLPLAHAHRRSLTSDTERPSVSNETAESVVKALNAFILEMERSRRSIERDRRARGERAGRERERREGMMEETREAGDGRGSLEESEASGSGSRNGTGKEVGSGGGERERIRESVVRARGSPVPMAAAKRQHRRRTDSQGASRSSNNKDIAGARSSDLENPFAAETNRAHPHPVASTSRSDRPTQAVDDSMYSLFSGPSTSPQPAVPVLSMSTGTIGKDKGKNKVMNNDEEVVHRGEPASKPSRSSSASRAKRLDLRELDRARSRRSSSNGGGRNSGSFPPAAHRSSSSSSSSFGGAIPPHSIRVQETGHSPHSSLKLSPADQTLLVEQTIHNLSREYQFPPDYVCQVWKEAGDLDEAVAILGQLRDMAGALLRQATVRRRSSGVTMGMEMTSRSADRESNSKLDSTTPPAGITIASSKSEFNKHTHHPNQPSARFMNNMNMNSRRLSDGQKRPGAETGSSSIGHRVRPREVFLPTILSRPLPDSGYSPPTHSRAGQFELLSRQGRMEEAIQREQRRVTGRGGVFVFHPSG
ncbi:hypothetical protein EV360DRAFT_84161 [Lentinula raphanica]|nr:hypothetical protein EV360DRAFT_84161 [Lentinula raphanica]